MASYWESLATRVKQHTAEQYEATAYRLISEQILYYADRQSRTAYWMVEQFEREFREALAPIGIDVKVNRQLRYAYAIPRHTKTTVASIAQTVLALVLRAIYDESIRMGQVTDDGEVICDLVELEEKHHLLSGRELPSKAKLDQLLDTMKRWGIARRGDEMASFDDVPSDEAAIQPYSIIIRPGVVEVLGETTLARLAQFHSTVSEQVAPSEQDETMVDEGNEHDAS